MATVTTSATDEAAGANRAGALAGRLAPNHWVAIIGVTSILYLWWVRNGSLRTLLD